MTNPTPLFAFVAIDETEYCDFADDDTHPLHGATCYGIYAFRPSVAHHICSFEANTELWFIQHELVDTTGKKDAFFNENGHPVAVEWVESAWRATETISYVEYIDLNKLDARCLEVPEYENDESVMEEYAHEDDPHGALMRAVVADNFNIYPDTGFNNSEFNMDCLEPAVSLAMEKERRDYARAHPKGVRSLPLFNAALHRHAENADTSTFEKANVFLASMGLDRSYLPLRGSI